MRIAVIVFPGSNCERETGLAIQRAGMTPVEVLWNSPAEILEACQGYVLVGGFSYEDRGRAGVIAAHLPIMDVIKQQSLLGKPVLGICNGAQILVESGLVSGAALTDNKRIRNGSVVGTGYYNAWVYLKPSLSGRKNAFTRLVTPESILKIPVAHAEGRFLVSEPTLGLSTFQYCDEHGNVLDEFPTNPNGSMANIAALSNKAGNVLAIMPHPERASDGDCLFESMRDYILSESRQLITQLIITDNHALTLEKALQAKGIPVRVSRQIHWQIDCDSEQTFEQIKASGVLFNENKEQEIPPAPLLQRGESRTLLVTPKEDLVGQQKMQMLTRHYGISGITEIKRSILWHIDGPTEGLDFSLFFNPMSHDCTDYDQL